MPAPLGFLVSPQSCYSLLFKYLWSGTMAEIFALVRGVMNMIQNGVCCRAKQNDLTGFSFILPIFSIPQRANVQKTIKLERKGLLGFEIDDSNSPTMVMKMFSRAAYAISALYLIYIFVFFIHFCYAVTL